MSLGIDKPWQPLGGLADLPGHMGVFELSDRAGAVLFVGVAGGRSRFGLRGEIQAATARLPEAAGYRLEVTTAYLTRYQELLMAHRSGHGGWPPGNDPVPGLGRLSPA